VEKYVGSGYDRLEIKTETNMFNPAGGFNPQSSWVARARLRVGQGMYRDPFSGDVGFTKQTDAAHIPLSTLPLTEAPAMGSLQGGANAVARALGGCSCN
jgi:hypothetical protein